MASVAPEGTAWARELHAYSRDVALATAGQVQIKWYLAGIAGDELTVLDRIKRGQLDGAAGAVNCERLGPSLRVMRILGLFRTRDEFRSVLGQLRQRIDHEFASTGFVNLGIASFGSIILFSRTPVRSLADMQRGHFWLWNLDEVPQRLLPQMGISPYIAELSQATAAYEAGSSDGFFSVPSAAMAFQWSTQARYVSDLPVSWLAVCLEVTQRAFDPLPVEHQRAIRDAAARLASRLEERGAMDDALLLGGLFQKQGLQTVHASDQFRREFFESARQARDRVAGQIVPPELMSTVLGWLADYRADHGRRE